jgi:hypothetical protein
MRSVPVRAALLASLFVCGVSLLSALQVKEYDPATGKWTEAQQFIRPVGGNSVIIWLFKPDGSESKAIAAVESTGEIGFTSTGIATGAESLSDLRFFDPPNYDPTTPGKWQKITKAELAQGRVVVTMDDGRIFTIYGLRGFSAIIESGRVIPESPKPPAN